MAAVPCVTRMTCVTGMTCVACLAFVSTMAFIPAADFSATVSVLATMTFLADVAAMAFVSVVLGVLTDARPRVAVRHLHTPLDGCVMVVVRSVLGAHTRRVPSRGIFTGRSGHPGLVRVGTRYETAAARAAD
ncbi:hypothetical protein [Nocardia cyriacigeorgica]|uniref:hypothetical protein n=1 Tax=Nocardia cyriacigeorgica TaxID=135487 RepID=UPI0018957E6A|nr:hypothetical protein [Nocardia cyriacigeorgica]MBF6416401.1 hypothetical protein [Nocardia cyriacigeorgica]